MMPNGDSQNRFFYPILTLMIDSYNLVWKSSAFKGQAAVGPTVQSGQWQVPRINGFSELSQVMSRSVTDCKHAGCLNQLIYWNVCTSLKTVCFNVGDHIKSAHTPIILYRVLCRSLKKRSVGAYVDLAPQCIQKRVYNLEIIMWSVCSLGQMLYT